MHIGGLENIVALYGGVEALEPFQAIRQSLFLYENSTHFPAVAESLTNRSNSTDVLGSLVYDTQPRFPQLHCPSVPAHAPLVACGQTTSNAAERPGIASLPDKISSIVINSAIESALRLAVLLNHMPRNSAHQMALDLLIPVCKIAHDILSLPRLHYGGLEKERQYAVPQRMPISAAAELVRITALALVATVITTTSGDDLYCAVYRRGHVRDLLVCTKAESRAGWGHLRLWVLVVQALMEIEPARAWLLDEVMDAMDSLAIRSWECLVSCLHQIAWVEGAATQEMARFKYEIEERLAHRANT